MKLSKLCLQIACKSVGLQTCIMGLNIKLLLDKRRIKEDNTYPLVMRIIYQRKSVNVPLGYSLMEKEWDDKKERVKTSSKVTDSINRLNGLIHKKRTNAYGLINRMEDEGRMSVNALIDIKRKLLAKENKENKVDVFSFIESIIHELYVAKRIGNAAVYKQLHKKLKEVHKKGILRFEQVDFRFLKKMESIHYSKDNGAGGLSVYLRTLRSTYNKAIRAGITDKENYPFQNYVIKSGVPKRRALSEEELKKLKEVDLTKQPHLNKAREFYLSSFYLRGINWMDMAQLRVNNIHEDRITYLRQKTRGKRFSIKIYEPLEKIIKNNLNEDYKEADYLFPVLKHSDEEIRHHAIIENKRKRLNKNLKQIAAILNIPDFTIYSARHTYAMALKRKGAPTNIIQESLGHTTEEMTQNYLDSFENEVIDQYDNMLI